MKASDSNPSPSSAAVSESAPPTNEDIPKGVLDVLQNIEVREEQKPQLRAAPSSAFGNLGIAQIIDVRGDEIDIRIGGRTVTAKAAPLLHRAVLRTASETGEPVLCERGADGDIVVVGALRTRPVPGVDQMEEVIIEADHIRLHGRKEVLLTSGGIASIAIRAAGEIETYAERIVSRAEELHKIVGRMLRLN